MTNQALTTTETLTNKQIKTLRQEAGNAGDDVTVAICDVALATRMGQVAEIDESVRGDLETMGIVPEHVGADVAARAKVAEMISDVEAERIHEATGKTRKQLDAEIAAALTVKVGARVEGGRRGSEDHDTGRVVAVIGDKATVAWDSGVTTTQSSSLLRAER